MKQREGPLCPCCRRDFIVDPLDLLEEEANNNAITGNDTSNQQLPAVFTWDTSTLDEDPDFGPIIVTEPGTGAGDFAYDPARLEEGLQSEAAVDPALIPGAVGLGDADDGDRTRGALVALGDDRHGGGR